MAAGVASLVAPCGLVRSIVSTASCDGRDLPALDDRVAGVIADAWAGHGLTLDAFRPATADELAGTHSTWARRLGLAAGRGVATAPGRPGRSCSGGRADDSRPTRAASIGR